jgi:hypothetical protein
MRKPARTAEQLHARGFSARPIDVPAPTRAEARRRIQSKPGFFASLSVAARSAIMGYDGPEILGPPRGEQAR